MNRAQAQATKGAYVGVSISLFIVMAVSALHDDNWMLITLFCIFGIFHMSWAFYIGEKGTTPRKLPNHDQPETEVQ